MNKISILGTGSWGVALGEGLARCGFPVTLWQRNESKVLQIKTQRTHPLIDHYTIHPDIDFTSDLKQAITNSSILVIAVPSHGVRALIKQLNPIVQENVLIVNAAKGLEQHTLLTMSQVITDELKNKRNQIVALYGPSHAEEVIRQIPTTLVAASINEDSAKKIQQLFSSNFIRVYTNSDLLGVELGGSLKNVIAIAAGICDGLGYGDNTKAAILTRGIAEMKRLGVAMGAKESTFSGLSGIGDLFVTCASRHSRNRFVGEEIGKGKKMDEILSGMKMVAEGVKTSEAVYQLCNQFQVEMPISLTVYQVIYNQKNPGEAVIDLMNRDLVSEEK